MLHDGPWPPWRSELLFGACYAGPLKEVLRFITGFLSLSPEDQAAPTLPRTGLYSAFVSLQFSLAHFWDRNPFEGPRHGPRWERCQKLGVNLHPCSSERPPVLKSTLHTSSSLAAPGVKHQLMKELLLHHGELRIWPYASQVNRIVSPRHLHQLFWWTTRTDKRLCREPTKSRGCGLPWRTWTNTDSWVRRATPTCHPSALFHAKKLCRMATPNKAPPCMDVGSPNMLGFSWFPSNSPTPPPPPQRKAKNKITT